MTDVKQKRYALLRIALGCGILGYLFWKMDLSLLGSVLAHAMDQWEWLVGGIVTTFLGLLMGVFRWDYILRAQGLRFTPSRVFSVFFIGQFFNAFMLGACGGDAARAIYVARDAPGKRAEAASTVFVDRAVGLFVLILFCCVMIAFRIPIFLDNQGIEWAGILMLFFLIGSVAALLVLFRHNLFERWTLFKRFEESSGVGAMIRRIYDAFFRYRDHGRTIMQAAGLSVLNMIFLTLACYCFGCSLEINLPMIDYFTLFPVITVLAAIPLTPGGLGLREGLFVTMFQAVHIDAVQALPLSLMVYFGGVFWSLFGGVLFLGYSSSAGHTIRQELDAIKHPDGDQSRTSD